MVLTPLHDADYAKLLQLLRQVRKEAGVTQVELARRLGVDQSLVSKVERQERRLDLAELRRVCLALGMPLIEFLERFEAMVNSPHEDGCDESL